MEKAVHDGEPPFLLYDFFITIQQDAECLTLIASVLPDNPQSVLSLPQPNHYGHNCQMLHNNDGGNGEFIPIFNIITQKIRLYYSYFIIFRNKMQSTKNSQIQTSNATHPMLSNNTYYT